MESALTLPLTIFLILGMIQLGMLLNGRMMAHYAAFRAARVGSVSFGDCQRMTHAAIAAVMPSIIAFMGPGTPGTTPSEKFANAFGARKNNTYAGSIDGGHTESIVWILRDRPTLAEVAAVNNNGQDTEFDQFQAPPMRLELRLIYWFPLKIPFANWVIYEMYRTHFGLATYTKLNPLMPAKYARWDGTASLMSELGTEMELRAASKHYVFPIQATYTMRMMTPAKQSLFAQQHCAPTPSTIAVP